MTYAKTGGAIGRQPDAKAFQVFDQKTLYLLEPRYNEERSVKWQADSFEKLGEKMGVDVRKFCTTMKEYNEATETMDFDPTRLDGLSTGAKLKVPKTHWALPLDKPPYMAYGVTCGMVPLSYRVFRFHSTDSPATGITFTYAGLKIDTSAHILHNEGLRMPGLWAVGKISGGFFCIQLSRRCWAAERSSIWTGLPDKRRRRERRSLRMNGRRK